MASWVNTWFHVYSKPNNKLFPSRFSRFIDVFGGSGTVLMNRPIQPGCIEIYNDYNKNLVTLFHCVKDRPMSLLKELGFLPLNSRDDFGVLLKFFQQEEFADDYLQTELELTQIYLEPLKQEEISKLLLSRAKRGDIQRAANFYKLIRYSFSANGDSFAGKPCDIRRYFYQIWECSRRLANVVIENKDFESLIRQYDRENAVFYCDPPYFEAEKCYAVEFTQEDHYRLHNVLIQCQGYVMVSYNYCDFICELYQEFYIFHTTRPNSMSLKPDSIYEEVVMTNYDPREEQQQINLFSIGEHAEGQYTLIHEPAQQYRRKKT